MLDLISKEQISTVQLKKDNSFTVQKKSDKNNTTGLPDNIKFGVENLSGISLDDVKVHYNSSKPAQMKALAYTQGTDIHVASGQEQHLGHEAWHVVQQKQGRVAPTTQLKGVNINDNSNLEHEADIMGAKAVQLKSSVNNEITQWKQPTDVAVQLKSEDAPMQFWGLGQHKEITEESFKLARKSRDKHYSQKDMEAIKSGAVFNDVHGRSTVGFGVNFTLHTDEFLNESHHGGMQFLHTMSNDEDAETNKRKQMAWANFCILTRNNKEDFDDIDPKTNLPRKFQDKKMLPYIRSLGEDDTFFEMMMPAMLHRSKYKSFIKKYPDLKKFTPKERAIFINHYLLMNESHVSTLANQTVAEFFQAGNKNLDAGLIASGSLAHMIEDSFANSHAQRTINLHQGDSKSTDKDKSNLLDVLRGGSASEEILKTQTPIMLHANYNEQQSLAVWGKHSKGDAFEDKSLNDTQGATQAQLAVSYILQQLDYMEDNNINNTAPLLDFIDKTLAVDNNVLALQKIQVLKNPTQEDINEIIKDTDFDGLGIDFLKNHVTTTKAGRQYEKTQRRFGHSSAFNGKGWMSKEKNKKAKKALKDYDDLLKKEQTNTVYKPKEKENQYFEQASQLRIAIDNSEVKEVKDKIKEHATEMLINVFSMQKQQTDINFQSIKDILVYIIKA